LILVFILLLISGACSDVRNRVSLNVRWTDRSGSTPSLGAQRARRRLEVHKDRIVCHDETDECLIIDRDERDDSGMPVCSVVDRKQPGNSETPLYSFPVEGIYGCYNLPAIGAVLVVMRGSETVLKSHHMSYDRVTAIEVIPLSSQAKRSGVSKSSGKRQLEMLCGALVAHDLFFSRGEADVTHTMQRAYDLRRAVGNETTAAWEHADSRFFWNRRVSRFLQAAGAHQWVRPVMNGFIDVQQAPESNLTYVLISRRSCERQGTRLERRGVDDAGAVANFVETEQCILLEDGAGRATSHVQIRGSIPLFWKHPPHLRYKPPFALSKDTTRNRKALRCHVNELLNLYQRVVFVNLIDKHGDQGRLGQLLKTALSALAVDLRRWYAGSGSPASPLGYVWWDFHHECSKKRGGWTNLYKLDELCKDDLGAHGFFALPATSTEKEASLQAGECARIASTASIERTWCRHVSHGGWRGSSWRTLARTLGPKASSPTGLSSDFETHGPTMGTLFRWCTRARRR